MSKESFERGLGRKFSPPQRQGKPFRPGKTQRDKESGAWGNRFLNRDSDPHRKR